MNFFSFRLTNIAITTLLLILTGCASSDSIKLKHISTIQEWKHTVNRTNTLLLKHNKIHFSVQLIVQYTPSGDEFTLDGFSIGENLTENSIDLLNPHFSKVRACSWKCYYLGDIVDSNLIPSQTYLTRFYHINKSELNQFYDTIHKISLSILNHSAGKQQLFIDKLILDEPTKFENLAAFEAFILTAYGDSVVGERKSILLNGQRKVEYAKNKLSYIQSPIGKVYKTRNHETTIISNSKDETYENKDLIQAQTVCSIQENIFGKVTKIDGDKITVHLKGQVKINNDGIYVTPDPGYLFDTLATFAYVDIDKLVVYDRRNLFKCDVGDE